MRIKGLWTVALTVWLVPVMSAVLSGGLAAQTPGPRMPLVGLEKLAAAASETVDLSLDGTLLGLAARFMDDGDAEEAKAKAMLSGLKGVYVRSYEFGADGALRSGGRGKDPPAAVGAGLVADGRRPEQEGQRRHRRLPVGRRVEDRRPRHPRDRPRRFTVVNIVGAIDLDQLRRLEGFGLPKLDLEQGKDKAPKDKARDKPKPDDN